MAPQIENTLVSLLPPYQRAITIADYEIILVDNGSERALEQRLQKLSPNLRYIYIPPNEANPNPAAALNLGVAHARGPNLCLMIDGARLLTPGVLSWGLRLLALAPRVMVEVRGWHLGPKWQPESITEGYDEAAERELLEGIRWLENGYRLWEIAAATPQVRQGYSAPTPESNCIFISRELFSTIGGYDERPRSAGGGLVNLDFFSRAVAQAETVFTLVGEGNFHQTHGGAATGLASPDLGAAFEKWRAESEELGHRIGPTYDYILAGHMPPECATWLARQAAAPALGGAAVAVSGCGPNESADAHPRPFLYLDPEMVGLLRSFGVDLVLDVGANCGQFALELIRAGYEGRILSFEPLAEAHADLLRVSRDYPQWRVAERYAIGDRNGEAILHVAGNSESSSLLSALSAQTAAAPGSRYVDSESVAMRTLDEVAAAAVADAARPFLKLDVQGFESRVLDGAKGLLGKLIGIQAELDLVPLYRGSVSLEEMLARLRGLGFALYRIRPGFTDRRSGRMLQCDGIFFREPLQSDEKHDH